MVAGKMVSRSVNLRNELAIARHLLGLLKGR